MNEICGQIIRDRVLTIEFVVPGILLNSVGLFGLLGNALSILVLSRPQMRSSINCILIGKLCSSEKYFGQYF